MTGGTGTVGGSNNTLGSVTSGVNGLTQAVGLGSVLPGTSGSGSSSGSSAAAGPGPRRRPRTRSRGSSAAPARRSAACSAALSGGSPTLPNGGASLAPAWVLLVWTTRRRTPSQAWIAPGEPIISLRGVTKSFGSHTVLEDITFDVPKGRITAILGPSGTGKSVLLKNILGLLRPERGEIWVDGDQIVGLREKRLYEVRKKFGVLFQDGALFGSMNLYDNIAFPLREHTRKNEAAIRELVHRNAELVGLMDHLKKLPGEVSGGMKKRAGLARAMVTEPEIVLFDEPDSGLDPVRVAYLDELVVTAQKRNGRDLLHHHPQHPVGHADGRLHGRAVPLQPGEVRQQAGHGRH